MTQPRIHAHGFISRSGSSREADWCIGCNRFSDQPADASVRKGTVFHERYTGERAVPYIDDGHLALSVWRKDDSGTVEQAVRYALAVTIGTTTPIPVYDEIQQRLRVQPRPPA